MSGELGARRSRGVTVLGCVSLVVGIAIILTTLDTPFIAVNSPDVRLLRIIHLDTFGGVLVALIGALALAGGRRRRSVPALVAGVLAAVLCVWSLVGLNTSLNLMGARADAVTFFLMIASGLLLFVLTPDPDVSSGRDDES